MQSSLAVDRKDSSERQPLDLSEAAGHLLDECRMVLPGIQALFGFQLIAVFNQRFGEKLSHHEQLLHLASMVLVVVAIGIVMAPAAFHRMVEPRSVSAQFIRISSWLLLCAMACLAAGICVDFYVVAKMIWRPLPAVAIAAALAAVFAALWLVLPMRYRLTR